MKNDGRPIRDSVPWNSRCTKDPHWLNNIFLFSIEIWAEQLKKHPVHDACIHNVMHMCMMRLKFCDGRTDGRTNKQGDSRSWMQVLLIVNQYILHFECTQWKGIGRGKGCDVSDVNLWSSNLIGRDRLRSVALEYDWSTPRSLLEPGSWPALCLGRI